MNTSFCFEICTCWLITRSNSFSTSTSTSNFISTTPSIKIIDSNGTSEAPVQMQYSSLLQLDGTYKLSWNELPLITFGASDCDRNFRPFGVALVSEDESSSCYEHLFNSLRSLSIQELHQPYSPKFMLAEGAPGINIIAEKESIHTILLFYLGITSAQQKVFPKTKRLMCWFHMIQKCRCHRHLVTKQQWNEIDKEIHAIQLSFSDGVFNHGVHLLMNKWRVDPSLVKFCDYFNDQWLWKLRFW